jgi:hypothetical protein
MNVLSQSPPLEPVQTNLHLHKLPPCLTNHDAMKTYGGVEIYFQGLISVLDEGERSGSSSGRFTPLKGAPLRI